MFESACEALIHQLVAEVPALKPVYDAHIAANDELLPHVFFGDVTRFVASAFARPAAASRRDASKVLAMLEVAIGSGDPDVENLVGVSFVENLLGDADLEAIRSALGSRLREELAGQERWRPTT